MGVLEFMPATRKVLRLLASEPEDFAAQHRVRLHDGAQSVAQHSLAFMKSFPLETAPDWFGHLAIEGESQQLAGICSLKGPPVEGAVEMAYFTFPGSRGPAGGRRRGNGFLPLPRLRRARHRDGDGAIRSGSRPPAP